MLAQGTTKIDAGGAGNCGFLSTAAAVIDSYRQGRLTAAINAGHFADFFHVYRRYYPAQLFGINLDTNQPFEYLIKNYPAKTVVANIAYALRQYAVDIISAEPDKYRGAYANKDEGTSPAKMRLPGNWIDESAIAALADGLQLPIAVKSSSLPKPLTYNFDETTDMQDAIKLHHAGGHYQAEVGDADYFAAPAAESVKSPLSSTAQAKESALSDAELAADLQITEFEIEARSAELLSKHQLTKLNTQDLIVKYKKEMERINNDYLPGQFKEITKEYSGDQFFSDAVKASQINKGREDEIREILIHALAKQVYVDHKPSITSTKSEFFKSCAAEADDLSKTAAKPTDSPILGY